MLCRLCQIEKPKQEFHKIIYFCCKKCYKKESRRVRHHNKRKNKPAQNLQVKMWLTTLLMHSFKCRFCHRTDIILDHIVSFHNGGDNSFSNIQPLCGPCNKRKTKVENVFALEDYTRFKRGNKLYEKSKFLFDEITFAP